MLLFVYGTIKRGGRNHALLLRQDPIALGEFQTIDRFALYIRRRDALPIAVRADGDGDPLEGELYEIADERVTGHLDPFEGHPDFYRREPVVLNGFDAGSGRTVWIYVFRRPVAPDDRRIPPTDRLLRYAP